MNNKKLEYVICFWWGHYLGATAVMLGVYTWLCTQGSQPWGSLGVLGIEPEFAICKHCSFPAVLVLQPLELSYKWCAELSSLRSLLLKFTCLISNPLLWTRAIAGCYSCFGVSPCAQETVVCWLEPRLLHAKYALSPSNSLFYIPSQIPELCEETVPWTVL